MPDQPVNASSDLPDSPPTDNNFQKWGFDAHPVISPVAGGILVLFVTLVPLFSEQADVIFDVVKNAITDTTAWFYVLVTNIYLITVVYLALSRVGRIRIGGPNAKPEFSTFSWYALLISAGMGIGLMFWSVAEPVNLFQAPPTFREVQPGTIAAAKEALVVTFFHWGLHAWGIYALIGLSLAFFNFNRGLPLTISALFYPLLKERIYSWPGYIIDILAVLATLSGLATSLGAGAQQINSGISFLFGLPDQLWMQLVVVAFITVLSALSVATGLKRGVRLLSEVNLYISAVLLLFVLLVGPTKFILDSFVEDIGYYISSLPSLSFWTEAFSNTRWQEDWTLFYWGWWIAWSPFVGTFIARVSKGRTVKEFVIGVVLVPSLLSFLWMSVFGGTALELALQGIGNLPEAVAENIATALFVLLEQLPITEISSVVGVILVVTFFVTSCNSGALVVNYLTSGGKLESPVFQRIFWVVMEGAVASVLLLGGGLSAMQAASITMGLPFAVVLLIMCYSLYQGLKQELAVTEEPAVISWLSALHLRERLMGRGGQSRSTDGKKSGHKHGDGRRADSAHGNGTQPERSGTRVESSRDRS